MAAPPCPQAPGTPENTVRGPSAVRLGLTPTLVSTAPPSDSRVLSLRLAAHVPCLNKKQPLPLVVDSNAKRTPSIDEILILIIEGGSSARTVEAAKPQALATIRIL